MTNSDRYSHDDYNADDYNADQIDADQIDEDVVETTMKSLAQPSLGANSAARRKAMATISSQKSKPLQSKPLQKDAQTAGTGIIWTLLGVGLAACSDTSVRRLATIDADSAGVADKDADSAGVVEVDSKPRDGTVLITIPDLTPTGSDQATQSFSLVNFIIDPDADDTVTYRLPPELDMVVGEIVVTELGPELRITPQAVMSVGTYTIPITGTSSSGSHTRDITFTVTDTELTKTDDPTDPIVMKTEEALSLIDYDDYFTDLNGRDQFTVTGSITGPNGYDEDVNFNGDGTVQGNLPATAGEYELTLTATPVSGAAGEVETVTITINASDNPPAVTAGATADRQLLRGDENANTFTIDTTASVKAEADVITNFDINNDKVTFGDIQDDDSITVADDFNEIWLINDGNDLLITTSNDLNTANVLAVFKNFFPNPLPSDYDFKTSLVNFDLSFIADRAKRGDSFEVNTGIVFEDNPDADVTVAISDGSADGRDLLYGSGSGNAGAEPIYLKIDIGTSAIDAAADDAVDAAADIIGESGNKALAFNDGVDKIILAGAGANIIAKFETRTIDGVVHSGTTLYKDSVGANNVLAVLYEFEATADNFDLTDFLIQKGQSFSLTVDDADGNPITTSTAAAGGGAGKQTLVGNSDTPNTFTIDTTASLKGADNAAEGTAAADVITGFDFDKDRIKFGNEQPDGSITVPNGFRPIWLKKLGNDLLITNSNDGTPEAPAANVLAVLKDVFKDVPDDYDFKTSLLKVDTDFVDALTRTFVMRVAEAIGGSATTRLYDGSGNGADSLTGSVGRNISWLRIDTTASAIVGADKIGTAGREQTFRNDHDKIILAGDDVTTIIVQVEDVDDGAGNQIRSTVLYSGSVGTDNVLAVLYGFEADADNFDLTDFLIQKGQGFSLTVDDAEGNPITTSLPAAGAAAGKQTMAGDGDSNVADTFTIDTTASLKGDADAAEGSEAADVITGFDFDKDKITFGAEGGGAPTGVNEIYLQKDGNDILITTSSATGATNVLAVLKDALKGVDFDLNSLVNFDHSFLAGRLWFYVFLDPAFTGVAASGDTFIHDGSLDRADSFSGGESDDTVYLKIDIVASDVAGADVVDYTINTFNATRDKIILAGAGINIFAQYNAATKNTTLYSTNVGAVGGTENVLAVIYGFEATADNFDITDFLVQEGQSFEVEVLDPIEPEEGNKYTGDSTAQTFTIDTAPSLKASADEITGFDLANDKIKFATDINAIWLKKDGNDLLIATSKADGANNVLAVLKDFFPDPLPSDYDFTTSLVNFDLSFLTDPDYLYFDVYLHPDLPGVADSGDTFIHDGSLDEADYFPGAELDEDGKTADTVYLKIDIVASDLDGADEVEFTFNHERDKIILAGDVTKTKIIAKVETFTHTYRDDEGKKVEYETTDTVLYKDSVGANNVLAVLKGFVATGDGTDGNFTIDDFLVQTGQDFTVEVIELPTAATSNKDDYTGDSTAQTFNIDNKPTTKAEADTVADFDLANDKIKFVVEGGGVPTGVNIIWLKKDGDDLLITTSKANGAAEENVLAVLTDVFLNAAADYDFKTSLVNFDLSFLDGNTSKFFTVMLHNSLDGVGSNIRIKDGSEAGAKTMHGSGNVGNKPVYIKIDIDASDVAGADVIGAGSDGTAFNATRDKIILAGDVERIVFEVKTTTVNGEDFHTTILYKDRKGDDNVLAVMYGFEASASDSDPNTHFDITDFLVQEGQAFTVVEAKAVTDAAAAGKQTRVAHSDADEIFTIDYQPHNTPSVRDSKAALEGTAAADVIRNFDLDNDRITFGNEQDGSITTPSLHQIKLRQVGGDLLITATDSDDNVFAILETVTFDLDSLLKFDPTFVDSRQNTEDSPVVDIVFSIILDESLDGVGAVATVGDTTLFDGSGNRSDVLYGSDNSRNPDAAIAAIPLVSLLRIDIDASDADGADKIGTTGGVSAFNNGTDKIILAGDGIDIYVDNDGTDTTLYSTDEGAAGTDNVLAVLYGFVATSADFDENDFLVQEGQSFEVEVL